jgi:hypothetical protein
MSPTESDLRASLRDGEGDVPDVDRIMAGAAAARSQRRGRILSTAAAVVVVAGIATGGFEIVSHSRDHESAGAGGSGGTTRAAAAAAAPAAAGGSARSADAKGAPVVPAPGGGGTSAAPRACAARLPRTLLPGGGSPGQFGASGKLFTKPVASVIVCSYGGASSSPARAVLDNAAGQALLTSLENASKTPFRGECPDYIKADAPTLAITAIATDGTALPTVTASLARPACATQISNGTVVRYDWSPPASLTAALASSPTATAGGASSPSH